MLACVRRGVHRPGAIEKASPGLSAKVLTERLNKLMRFGVIERRAFSEVPPRVEYHLTVLGERFVRIVDEIDALERELGEAKGEGKQ